MYNVNFGQDRSEGDERPVEVVEEDRMPVDEPMPEDRMPEDRIMEDDVPVVTEEEVILVPPQAKMTTGQKVALGVGLGSAGLVVIGGMIVAGVMKSREG